MVKVIMVLATVFVAYMGIRIFAPSLMHDGFTLGGHSIAWGLVGLGVIGYICYKAK